MPQISRVKSPAPPPPPSRNSPAPKKDVKESRDKKDKKEKPRLPPSRKKLLDMSIRNTSVGDLSVAERE